MPETMVRLQAIQIHVTDLQQLADLLKHTLHERDWARMQGAVTGLQMAIAAAKAV